MQLGSLRGINHRARGASGVLFAMAFDEFFQIFTGVRYMFPQSRHGYIRIFRFADVEKLAVGRAGAVQVTRKDQVETSVAVAVEVEFLQ